ncbi:MAG: hypothetical protein AAGJ91_17555 [Pseudomonadota bacterium]
MARRPLNVSGQSSVSHAAMRYWFTEFALDTGTRELSNAAGIAKDAQRVTIEEAVIPVVERQ